MGGYVFNYLFSSELSDEQKAYQVCSERMRFEIAVPVSHCNLAGIVPIDNHCELQEVVKKFAREEIAQKAAEYDKTGEVG